MTSTALMRSLPRHHELISNSLHRNHVTHVTLIVLLFSDPYSLAQRKCKRNCNRDGPTIVSLLVSFI
ncbi:uncharacterized protein BKA55DRAFT_561029, partial [Fusarium redolens]